MVYRGLLFILMTFCVTGKDEKEDMPNLNKVLSRLKQAGLHLNRTKCCFMMPSVEYLGYSIDKKMGFILCQTRWQLFLKFQTPSNIQDLQVFLGLVNYYKKFIPRLSTTLYPLYQLLCKGAPWVWNSYCKQAFNQQLKTQLLSTKVLIIITLS